jgi:hypothetical protein
MNFWPEEYDAGASPSTLKEDRLEDNTSSNTLRKLDWTPKGGSTFLNFEKYEKNVINVIKCLEADAILGDLSRCNFFNVWMYCTYFELSSYLLVNAHLL